MANPTTSQRMMREITAVISRRTGMVPDDVTPVTRISAWFDGDPGQIQVFVRDLEKWIGLDICDSVLEECPTFGELGEWCAKRCTQKQPRRTCGMTAKTTRTATGPAAWRVR